MKLIFRACLFILFSTALPGLRAQTPPSTSTVPTVGNSSLTTIDYLSAIRQELKPFPDAQSIVGETPDDILSNFTYHYDDQDNPPTIVPVKGEPFEKAASLVVNDKFDQNWKAQLIGTNKTDIKGGDTIFITLTARCVVSSAEQQIGSGDLCFQGDASHTYQHDGLTIPGNWQRFNATFKAGGDQPAGTMKIYLSVGLIKQTLEVGGIAMFNLGQNPDVSLIPQTKIDLNYAGRALDAPWRAAADARIDKYRKADLKVKVVNAQGQPVPGADVHIAMKKHKFLFGTVLQARMLATDHPSPDDLKVQDMITRYFSMIGFSNDLKEQGWTNLGWGQPQYYNKDQTLKALHWLNDRGFAVKGHVLVYNSPDEWTSLPQHDFQDHVEDHLKDEATACKGLIQTWDVVNEAGGNNKAAGLFGNDAIIDWFRMARECDPNAKLFINEAGAEQIQPADRQAFLDRLDYLTSHDADFDGIGLESHFNINSLNPPEELYKVVDKFAQYKKQIAASELDITADRSDPDQVQAQADYLRDALTVYFSHPAVTEIIQWGFWEGDHWIPSAALWSRDWSIRPNGQAFLDLVYKKWWTDETNKTGVDGVYSTRGFLGDYEITATSGDKTSTTKISLDQPGQTVTVQL